MYNQIFFTNILRILDERGMTKQEFSKASGISISFLSDLTNGKANPSLKVMEQAADTLGIPLPVLLESTDLDQEELAKLIGKPIAHRLPPGYEQVVAILPDHQAFIVKKWHAAAREKRGKKLK